MASQQTPPNVRVGVSALVVNPDGKILVGRRKGSHGSGETRSSLADACFSDRD